MSTSPAATSHRRLAFRPTHHPTRRTTHDPTTDPTTDSTNSTRPLAANHDPTAHWATATPAFGAPSTPAFRFGGGYGTAAGGSGQAPAATPASGEVNVPPPTTLLAHTTCPFSSVASSIPHPFLPTKSVRRRWLPPRVLASLSALSVRPPPRPLRRPPLSVRPPWQLPRPGTIFLAAAVLPAHQAQAWARAQGQPTRALSPVAGVP